MTSMAVSRSFECAPHAARSLAMALTLSLNLVILLFALRPIARFPVQVPIPLSLQATIVQPPPAVVPPPTVPTLHVMRRDTPNVHVAIAHPVPISIPVMSALTPVTPLAISTNTVTTNTAAASVDSEATIAYETATPPAYPIQALRAGVQGTVLLKVLVDTSGKPVQVAIERSSGSRTLDDAARQHVLAAWRFHPAMRDGHAIQAWALVPVKFNLDRL
ncbi:MAG TPA: energy transducer TonB [Rhodanobacteraceae bacterium]|nr:energy transducer TonB [Rhodanobacteraceae bacterium]